ncbi:MAG: hypothetical protein WA160_09455 [Pseudobdellovibrio sp.]
MIKLLGLILLVSLTSQAASTWGLQELARGSNALLVLMDLALETGRPQCGLSTPQIGFASQNLKMLIDQRATELKSKKNKISDLMLNCQQDCTCDIYEYALTKISGAHITETKPLSSQKRLACYKKVANFCKSELFKKIKK